jgi:predicted ATPase
LLDQITVGGFKALFERQPVRLQPLTLLVGRNGSGKSSLLEALQWLQESVLFGLSQATNHRFGSFSDLLNRRATFVELDLVLDEGPHEVRYQLDVKERIALEERPIVAYETCRENRRRGSLWSIQSRKGKRGPAVRSLARLGMNPIRDGDQLALSAVVTRKGTSGAERLREYLQQAVFLRLSPIALARPDGLIRGRGPLVQDDGQGTVALLRRLDKTQRMWVMKRVARVIDGAEDVRVKPFDKDRGYVEVIERMRARGGSKPFPIPSWLLSEGTRRLVTLFSLLAVRPRPSLLAIEEIENGLDPWTLTDVFKELRLASEEGIQVLLTTHSPFLLDHVQPDEVLRVLRSNGDTTFTPVSEFSTVAKYADVVAPGAMYLSGFLDNHAD